MRPVLLPLVLFLAGCAATLGNTVDDAFITFRYARNLALGNGLVFNLGERVEGFSNFLWLLLLAAAQFVGLDPVSTAKVLGILCGAATLLFTWRLAAHLVLPIPYAIAALVCLATNIGFVYFAVAGLETALYTAQITLLCVLVLDGHFVAAAAVCAAVALTRPEGIIYAGALVVGMVAAREPRHRIAVLLTLPVLAYVGLTAFRAAYFGRLLPNTFAAKADLQPGTLSFLAFHTHSLLIYAAAFARTQLVEGFLAFPCAIGLLLTATRQYAVIPAAMAIGVVFIWVAAGDWMPFTRFFVPVLPLLFTCGYLTLSWMQRHAVGIARWGVVSAAAIPIAWNLATTPFALYALNTNTRYNPAMHSRPHLAIGDFLHRVAAPSDVVVTNEIGAIGYRSDLTVVDMQGLIDREVPQLLSPATRDEFARHILAKSPRFVLLNDKNLESDSEMPVEHRAVRDEAARRGYVQHAVIPLNRWKHVIVFVPADDVLRRTRP